MKKGFQKVLVLLLTLSMLMSMMAVPGFAADELDPADQTIAAETAEDTAGIDAVKEMISKLPNSSDVTEADREAIVAAGAAYEALLTEEQAQLDNETCPSDGQSYGRVLESAQWGLWSLEEVDNTTTLAPGTYDASTLPALSSSYSKGKSTSSRQKPWSVKSITVDENHKVTAIVTVQSSSYSGIIYQGKTYNKTNTSGNCEFEPIPIDLNSTFYFSGVSTSMPRPIAFSVTTEIDEPAAEADADYTAVDAALAKVPEDLSIYTDETAAAVTTAVNAVVRGKKASEQEAVDAMAKAIEDAVAALKEKESSVSALDQVLASIESLPFDSTELTAEDAERVEAIQAAYNALSAEDQTAVDKKTGHPNGDSQSYGRVLEASVWAVRSFNTDTSTTLPDATYTTTTDPAVSSVSNKGKSDSSRTRNWWVDRVVVKNGQATAYIYVTSGEATAKKLSSYPSVWIGGQSVPKEADNTYPIPVDLNGITYFGGVSSSMPRPIMYTLETTIDEPAAEADADYTAVDTALAKVPEDLSIYTDETAAAVTTAVNAVVRGKKASEQEAVDAMAKAIEDAVAALKEKDADPVLEDGTYTATKVSTDVTTEASGMIMVTKATVVIKDGKATAVVTMKGTGADRFYVSDTATKDTVQAEAIAEEQKEVNGEFSNLLGGLVMEGESAYTFWPVPITLGQPKVFAARSADHFRKQDKTPEQYWYVHDFQIDVKDLQKVSDSTELPITEQQEAQRYLNQYFMDGKVVTSETAAAVTGKNANVTIPYYDGEGKEISSFVFKMAESDQFRSGWFVDSSILNKTHFSNSNLKKIRYPEGADGTVTFSPKAAFRDEGMTFTATLKLYPKDATYNQYDADGVYYDKEPLAEQTFTFTVVPKPEDRHVTVKVVDAITKEAIDGASVTVTKDADGTVVELSEGTYTMGVPGTYTVKASAEGYLVPGGEETEYVNAGYAPKKDGETLQIELIKAEESKDTITFDLKDQMGEAVVNPQISVYPWDDKEAVVTPEEDGSYKLYHGIRYGYTVKAEGYEDKTGTIIPVKDDAEEVKVNKYLTEQKFTFKVYDNKTNETLSNVALTVKYGPSGQDESTYTEAQPDENGVYTIPIDNRVIAYGHAVGYEDSSLGVWSLGFDPLKECSFGLKAMYPTLTVDKTNAGMMKPAEKAFLTGEKTVLLPMENNSFSAVYVGEAASATDEAAIALSEEKTFTFDVEDFDKEMTIAFKSKKNGNWLNKKVTVSKENGTLVIVDDKADYTKVDAAKATIPEDLSIYTEASVKAVNDAVAAVKTGKNSAEQAAVDAMAKAIDDAVAKLQLKPADYSKVDAAIAKVPKDMSKYTDASVKAVNDAVKAVVRGKMANEQAAVDNMAKAINNAVAGLKAKEAKKGWVSEGGYWYFYDNSGNMVKNSWAKDSVGWCYLGADGRMTRNAWVTDSHGWCWIGADGYWATGSRWISCNGSWYYISNGYMVANAWQRDSVGWCYLGSDGKMVTNGWASDSHGWCWLGSNGYWTSSTWVLDNGEWYYIKPNHYMAANEWARDSVGWMYMAANGKVTRSQWIKDGGYWYYLKADGYMATGTLKIGSKTYTFASSGRWVK